MFAIFQDGGKQYRVEEGQHLYLDRRDAQPGDKIELTEVLSIESDDDFQIGQPRLDGAKVLAEVVGDAKGPKLIFHRFRRRQGSRSRRGHRQKYTEVKIQSIHA